MPESFAAQPNLASKTDIAKKTDFYDKLKNLKMLLQIKQDI